MAKNSTVTTLDDEAPANAEAKAAAVEIKGANADDQLSGEKVTLTIHVGEGVVGREAVSVGLNGFMYQIPRGKPVTIPLEVYLILKNAVHTTYQPLDKGGAEEVHTPRFAITVER